MSPDHIPSSSHKHRLGLVLSGGGARSLAHIGVFKALEEAGITPDFLAGTSMGGVIAAMCAMGLRASEMEKIAIDASRTRHLIRMADLDYCPRGIFRGEQLLAFYDRVLEERIFTDLGIPLAITCVDLNSGLEVNLREGSVAQALRATTCIPGLFHPVETDGMRLVDGGLVNNLPGDVAREMGADVILAIDVGFRYDTAWRAFFRFRTISNTVSGFSQNVSTSMELMIKQQQENPQRNSSIDFLVRPNIPARITTLTGFKRVSELVGYGAAATRLVLPELVQRLL